MFRIHNSQQFLQLYIHFCLLGPMSGMPDAVQVVNGTHPQDGFHNYFNHWLQEQSQDLEELVTASREQEQGRNDRILRPLLEQVIRHYEHYYHSKSRWAENNTVSMFNPSWRSSLEDAFLWIGGWRPSMAFHLLYSKSGIQLEAGLSELIRGLHTGDLGDFSQRQLSQVDELQKRTINEEKEITEKFAKHQETAADMSMVKLSHVTTEMMGEGTAEEMMDDGQVAETLAPKEEGFVEILKMADDLRLETLKRVLNVLTPVQSAHFLIAAAELHLRVHEWFIKKDARRDQNGEPSHSHS